MVNDAVEPFAYGNTTVTWTITDGSGNIATCEQVVTVYTPDPTAYAGDNVNICEGTSYEILDATATNYGSVLWTGGAGVFNDATLVNPIYTPDPSEYGSNVYLTLTAQPISPCVAAASDVIQIFIYVNPTAFAGNPATVCAGDSYLLIDASAENFMGVSWSTDGDGDFDNPTIQNPTYTPAGSDIGNVVTLTMIVFANTPCTINAFSDMLLTVQLMPSVELGADIIACANAASVELNATLTGGPYASVLWSENGMGSIVDPTVVPASYVPDPSDVGNTVIFVLDVIPETPCSGTVSDYFALTFQPLPTVNPGPDATINSAQNYTISGASASNNNGVLWTTTGDGTFTGSGTLTPTYYPGAQDIIDGEVFLWIEAFAINPCTVSAEDNMALTIEGLPPVVVITSPLDGAVVNYNPVTITGTATDPENNVSFVEVRVNGGPWQLATGTNNWSISVTLGQPCDNLIEARATDTQLLESAIVSIEVEMHGQVIPLQAGWQFISSYINPVNTSLPVIYQGLTPLNNLIMMNNQTGQIYSPTFGNTIGPWNPYVGYKVKMNTTGSLQMYGENVPNQTLNLPKYSYLPVLTNFAVDITDIFSPSEVLLIYEQQTNSVYWPDGGITTTLTQLKPGYGYLTQLKNPTTIEYPPFTDCPLIPFSYDNAQLQNTSPWKLNRSADVHLINIQESALASIPGYDFIGAFNSDGTCIGYVDLKLNTGSQLLTVYGNDDTTDDVDGALENEVITLIAYNSADQTQETLQAVYSKAMPNNDGTFVPGGASMIVELKATTTGVADIASDLNVQLFPNPAKEKVTIVHSGEVNAELIVNIIGTDGALVKSVVMTEKSMQIDLTNIKPGVYIVKLESEGKVAIQRLVVQ